MICRCRVSVLLAWLVVSVLLALLVVLVVSPPACSALRLSLACVARWSCASVRCLSVVLVVALVAKVRAALVDKMLSLAAAVVVVVRRRCCCPSARCQTLCLMMRVCCASGRSLSAPWLCQVVV